MVKSIKRQINPVTVIIIIFEIVFTLFVIFTIRGLFSQDKRVPNIGIENYSVLPELSIIGKDNGGIVSELDDEKRAVMENVLYEEILFNNRGNIYNSGAKIREGFAHYTYISELGIYVLNYIVDIESLQQSYRVVYRWADKYPNENIPQNVTAVAFCLNDEELIYGDFECRDQYSDDVVVYDLLQNKTFNNSVLNLSGDVYNGEPLIINIYVNSNEESDEEIAVDEISSYLASVGFDLADFNYEVGTYFVY